MDTVRAYKLCGTDMKSIERRRKTEKDRLEDEALKSLFQFVLESIKETTYQKKDVWKKVSFEQLMRDKNAKATFRSLIMQKLQACENIISRPAARSNAKDGTLSHTVPLEFKYVEEQEKIDLAADAVCFRKVQGPNKARIINALGKMNRPMKSQWADLFATAEQLITRGTLKSWVYTRPLDIAAMTSVPVVKVIDCLVDLYDAKVLAIRDFDKPLEGETVHVKSICHWAKNDQEYNQLMTMPLNEIESVALGRTHRAPRRSTKSSAEKIQKAIDEARAVTEKFSTKTKKSKDKNTAKAIDLVIKTGDLKDADRRRDTRELEDIMAAILRQGVEAVKDTYHKRMDNEISEYKNKIAEKNNKLSQQSIESADLRDEVRRLKNELEKSKSIQKKLVEFNDGVIAAAQDANYTLMGEVGEIVQEFAKEALKNNAILKDKTKINNLTGRIVKATEVISNSMLAYKRDVFPPAEKA